MGDQIVFFKGNNKKGFTLIELLVVIAIISLLSSVVFASLSSARAKAKDASIKEEVAQLAVLMNLNYNDSGSYCALQVGWIAGVGDCNALAGTYSVNAQKICSNLFNNAANWGPAGRIFSNSQIPPDAGSSCARAYSFMVALNDGNWFCSGSSGAKGEYGAYGSPGDGTTPGCWNNP